MESFSNKQSWMWILPKGDVNMTLLAEIKAFTVFQSLNYSKITVI